MQMLSQAHLPPRDESLAPFAAYSQELRVKLFRPLLGAWRWQILDYCKEMGLEPRWDSTNWEPKYRRNRVRHDLIPMLQIKYSLAIKEHLYNLSQIAQDEDAWLSRESSEVLARLSPGNGPRHEIVFDAGEFTNLSRGTQRRVVREAMLTVAGTERDFTFRQVESARAIMSGQEGSPRAMHLPHGLVVERIGDKSYVKLREQPVLELQRETDRPLMEEGRRADFETESSFDLSTVWRFESGVIAESSASQVDLEMDAFSAIFDFEELQKLGPLEWRTRQPGDYMQPLGMSGRKTLQDVMVDAKIPRGQRGNVPLLAVKNKPEIIWIPGKGGRRSMHAAVNPQSTQVIMIRWSNNTGTLAAEPGSA
jgi:tRNA(Ile)-lysidine synthase